MPSDGFEALRRRVHASPELAAALAAIAPDRFRDELVARAAELGLRVDAGEVDAAVADGNRAWTLRWLR
jgi:hypothetical protein